MGRIKREAVCPMDGLLRVISGPWTTYILWRLANFGEVRFGELKRLVPGISSRVLTDRPRGLESAGLVYRIHKPTIPPQVSYGLTEHGMAFRTILDDLNALATKLGMTDGHAGDSPARAPGAQAAE